MRRRKWRHDRVARMSLPRAPFITRRAAQRPQIWDAVHPIRLLARRPPIFASVSRPPRHKSSPVILLSPAAAREFRHRAEPDGQGNLRGRSQPTYGFEAEPTERPPGGVRPQHRRRSQPARKGFGPALALKAARGILRRTKVRVGNRTVEEFELAGDAARGDADRKAADAGLQPEF